jgi:phospholipid/cholesterol/gamma-HCH transport system permease protein
MASPFGIVARETVTPLVEPFRLAGRIGVFSFKALVNVPAALRYRAVILEEINAVAVGTGAFLVGAGAIVVMIFMTAVLGVQVWLEGTKGLELIGAEALIGFVSAFANIREIAPLGAGMIFAAQIGAQFTALLGARRVSDEIDALEVMSVPTLRYLVSTRLIAGYVTVLPLYAIGLYVQLLTTRWTSVHIFDISPGIYDQYFELYLPREDVLFSVLKVLVFITLVTFIHCYYGFHVRGGPADVGHAVGRSVRLSVTLIFVVNFLLSLVFFGATDSIRFSG